jgi:hypothetical protein
MPDFFFQPWNDLAVFTSPDPAPIRRLLDRAADAGAAQIYLQHLNWNGWPIWGSPAGVDAVARLLDEADARDMVVWLGLWNGDAVFDTDSDAVPLPDAWEEVCQACTDVAIEVVEHTGYTEHGAFAGWYWTPEVLWGVAPSGGRLQHLIDHCARSLQAIRELTPHRPIALCIGPPSRAFPSQRHTEAWALFAEGVRPDRIIVMDGAGDGRVLPHELRGLYTAAQRAQNAARQAWIAAGDPRPVALVADLEIFDTHSLQRTPTVDRARLQAQIAAAAVCDEVCAFDLPHYFTEGCVAQELWTDPIT